MSLQMLASLGCFVVAGARLTSVTKGGDEKTPAMNTRGNMTHGLLAQWVHRYKILCYMIARGI